MNEICFFNFISTDCPKLGFFYRRLNYIIINMSKMPFFIPFVISFSIFGPEPSSWQNPRIAIIPACQWLGRNDHTTGLFLEATDRLAERTMVAAPRIDEAIVVEEQVVRAVAKWSTRPIAAAAADIVQRPTTAAAITRSRVPDGRSTAKIAGEVYTFFIAVIILIIRR